MKKRPNIILISADSLRADHLGCYGYRFPTSPNMDAMACDGVLAEKMFCPVLPTQPSHTTIFTGQHPLTHGVVSHGGKAKLARGCPFLPEVLLAEGYTTCAVDTLFRERMWFHRGYEYIIDPGVHHVFYANVTQEELNQRAIHWMKHAPTKPFFMFIHYWDVHYPYIPPERYQNLFYESGNPTDPDNHELDAWWDHPIGAMAHDTWLRSSDGLITDPKYVTALYDREIRYLDDGIADLRGALETMGIADDTLIMLLADHGESMTEHRINFDHYGLYDSTMRVPLIVNWPGGELRKGTRLPNGLQLSDVAPTLLEAACIPAPPEMEGRSFLKQMRGQAEQTGYDRIISLESTWQAKYCLRTNRYKFILAREQDLLGNPPRELYDLESDPGETRNIAGEDPKLSASLEQEMEGWIADKLKLLGRTKDPVVEEGASMVATWLGHRA
jgi:arylsulfatase